MIVLIYYLLFTITQDPQFLDPLVVSGVASILFVLITLGSYSFAADEVKNTAGVTDVGDLPFSRLIALYLFSLLVALGFVTLFVVSIEILNDAESTLLSRFLILITVAFLLIFPFFEFYSLSEMGEESAIPAEFIIEELMEDLAQKLKSRILATLVAYLGLYILPIFLLIQFLHTSFITAILLWALVLPMANLGALAGSGLGEDLLTLKLVRKGRFWKDFFRLGWPKLKFRDPDGSFRLIPEVELGRALLVLFAIQALLTTLFFVIENVLDIVTISQKGTAVASFSVGAIFTLSILNKGRGALKEMLAVWNESGFKISTLSLFLPVFVLMGVVLASILEVYASLSPEIQNINVLGAFGVNRHPRLVLLFLILQNFILLVSSTIVILNPPGSVERRLVWQIPEYYEDISGWVEFYHKIHSEKALVALLDLAREQVSEDNESHNLFKEILHETLNSPKEPVRVAASKALLSIIVNLDQPDEDYYMMLLNALEDESVGVKIFATRALKYYAKLFSDDRIMEMLLLIISKLYDPDVSVSWEANRTLQVLIDDVPSLRGAIIALVIRTVTRRTGGIQEQVLNFIHQISRKSHEIGSLLISSLITQLHQEDTTQEQDEQIIEALRQILRARPSLTEELLGLVVNELENPDLTTRRNSAKILSNMASFQSNTIETITQHLLSIFSSEDKDIRLYALKGLRFSIRNDTVESDQIFNLIKSSFDELMQSRDQLIATVELIAEIVKKEDRFDMECFNLLSLVLKKNKDVEVILHIIRALTYLADNQNVLAEDLFFIAENLVENQNEQVKSATLDLLFQLTSMHSEMARPIYRLVSDILNSSSGEILEKCLKILGEIGIRNNTLAQEILDLLNPYTNSQDWNVRNSAYHASFRIGLHSHAFQNELIRRMTMALKDADGRVSETALDAVELLLERKKDLAKEFLGVSKKLVKSKNIRNRQTGALLLGNLVERDLTLVDEALILLPNLVTDEEMATRNVAKQVLKQTMERVSKMKSIPGNIEKGLNKMVTVALKGANHSSASIRRDAYETMTLIAEAIPRHRIADRVRKAIERSQKRQEKDPALLEFLEECRIRAKPPVYYVKEEGKIKV
ncbi:MAG: hypothetical protein D6732_08830 [Methanobacteriota archaeon]|nr:MAG: hypothetical protein D6732_08830 [Euryarchaeota archaeon]